MKKYNSNYAKNKDINESYLSSNNNSKDQVSNQNSGNYFRYKDYEDKTSFQMKLSSVPHMPEGSTQVYKKR